MADIEFEIDGKTITAKPNQTVIQAADEAGIYIPRFCYHKHLSIAANCRMCLVEVEKSPKALPACATPVAPGMKVFTQSAKTIQAQRAVMEFLLINHPLDCPICDQGGECELQDIALGYGSAHSEYTECKRAVADLDLGPLIATEMTRCIHCTRCVRFGDEVAGLREMGAIGRGEHTEIGTYISHAIKSEISGNIIDLCPVGALTAKPYRFTARAWDLKQAPSISPHDCVGANLNVHYHSRHGKVMRVVARENNQVNETWLADRDRFSYAGLYHADRLQEPMMRVGGEWQAVSWEKALERAAANLQTLVAEEGADKLGALASPSATVEEFYLLQKVMRGLGSPHIDHRLKEMDTRDQAEMPAYPGMEMSFAELEQSDAVILMGSHLNQEQPLLAWRVRKAALRGATVIVINSYDYTFNFKVHGKKIIAPHRLPALLAALTKALAKQAQYSGDQTALAEAHVDAEIEKLASLLLGKTKVSVLLGTQALQHPEASALRYLARQICAITQAKLGLLTSGGNQAGAWLAGAVSHRHPGSIPLHESGLSAYEMLAKPRKGYLLLNVEPEFDFAHSHLAVAAMQQAQTIVALSLYRDPILETYADVILPIAAFAETAGTLVNASGEWQSFTGAAKPVGASRPAWKVLRVLANFLHLEGFEYASAEEIKQEVRTHIEKIPALTLQAAQVDHSRHIAAIKALIQHDCQQDAARKLISRIGETPIYAVDTIVRRSAPLQQMQAITAGDLAVVRMHPKTAAHLGLQAGDIVVLHQHTVEIRLPVMLDACVAQDAAWIAASIGATRGLGDLFGEIQIKKV